jgi:hypothetical protein
MALELWDLGYDQDNVKVLAEGLPRWKDLGYPVVATEN